MFLRFRSINSLHKTTIHFRLWVYKKKNYVSSFVYSAGPSPAQKFSKAYILERFFSLLSVYARNGWLVKMIHYKTVMYIRENMMIVCWTLRRRAISMNHVKAREQHHHRLLLKSNLLRPVLNFKRTRGPLRAIVRLTRTSYT